MNNIQVTFFDKEIDSDLVGFTNIVCIYNGKWLLVREKNKTTWELPGGHCEKGENSLTCAKRELYEETGIKDNNLLFICSRKIEKLTTGTTFYGNVYISKISQLGQIPESEIEEIGIFENVPQNLTYPFIQIDILKKAEEYLLNIK